MPYRQVDKSLTEHLGTHVKSTLPHDVWMVSNECLYFKIVDINKIKRAPIGANNKKSKRGKNNISLRNLKILLLSKVHSPILLY